MATFTSKRDEGAEYADHLFSSYPVMARRELGNMLSEFLRPDKWMSIHVDDEELDESDEERKFLEMLTDIQWRVMSDKRARLTTSTGYVDHSFAAIGNGVLQVALNRAGDGLSFPAYHMRDVVWMQDAEQRVDCVHRNWNPTAAQLWHYFRDKVSDKVKKALEKDPQKEFPCRHVVMPSRLYDYKTKGGRSFPFVSLYVERESETVLEEVGMGYFCYVTPRWQQSPGSVYGMSMATDVLLPDARTLQVMMRTLREAGEKFVDPPMLAIADAIRSDIALYAGGITTADMEYDGKLGEVLRPVTQNHSGFPIGMDLAQALKEDIRSGFFLDKIQLPELSHAMTATEVRRRIQEHIRSAAPITKPIQQEYNHPLCEAVFHLLMEGKAFPIDAMPQSLQGKDIKFSFRSPLDELSEQNDADTYADVMARIVMPALQFDPSQIENVDITESLRDAMRAAGWKAKWFKPKEAVEQRQMELAQQAEEAKAAQQMQQMGMLAEQGGKGIQSIAQGSAQADTALASGQAIGAI